MRSRIAPVLRQAGSPCHARHSADLGEGSTAVKVQRAVGAAGPSRSIRRGRQVYRLARAAAPICARPDSASTDRENRPLPIPVSRRHRHPTVQKVAPNINACPLPAALRQRHTIKATRKIGFAAFRAPCVQLWVACEPAENVFARVLKRGCRSGRVRRPLTPQSGRMRRFAHLLQTQHRTFQVERQQPQPLSFPGLFIPPRARNSPEYPTTSTPGPPVLLQPCSTARSR